jgi:riboflavin kinase/FMN adenylyltransferase
MRIIRSFVALPQAARGAVVAIGNFDGVHRGHRRVIEQAVEVARSLGAPAGVMTFTPHPRRFFRPEQPPFLLTRLREKLRLVAATGVDQVHLLRFDARMAALSPEAFVDGLLRDALGVRHVCVGYDFVFGRGRAGTAAFLATRLAGAGIGSSIVAPVSSGSGAGDEVFSSTAARQALAAGDPARAAAILGRAFAIEGRVASGDRRGRTIGFPTANLWLGDIVRPRHGVYAVEVEIAGAGRHGGVANLGLRPTFGGDAEPRLETHLFGFAGDLYGRRIRVELRAFLRPERRFDGLDALKAQIAADAAAARDVLSSALAGAPAGGCDTRSPCL